MQARIAKFSFSPSTQLTILSLLAWLCVSPVTLAQENATEFLRKAEADSQGRAWKKLWNEEDLSDFDIAIDSRALNEDPLGIYQVVDGTIHVYRDSPAGTEMPMGVLVTREPYSDYRMRFEYRWGEKKFVPRTEVVRDAGLLYHVVRELKVWPRSVECQVQEGDTGDVWTVFAEVDATVVPDGDEFRYAPTASGGVRRSFGSMDGIARIIKQSGQEKDGWNQVEVIVRGDSALHLVNGEPIAFVTNMRQPGESPGSTKPLTSGRLAFQAECAEVIYRNLEILPLGD